MGDSNMKMRDEVFICYACTVCVCVCESKKKTAVHKTACLHRSHETTLACALPKNLNRHRQKTVRATHCVPLSKVAS